MKLLIGMNLSPLWVEFFAASELESIHWSKIGDSSASDCMIRDYAAANGFVISLMIWIPAHSQIENLSSRA